MIVGANNHLPLQIPFLQIDLNDYNPSFLLHLIHFGDDEYQLRLHQLDQDPGELQVQVQQ